MTAGESYYVIRRCGLDGHDCEVLIDTSVYLFDIGKLTNISGTLCVQNHL